MRINISNVIYSEKFKANMEWFKKACDPKGPFGWVSGGTNEGVDCYSATVDNNMCFMGKMRFPYPSYILFDLIRSNEAIKKYDDMLEKAEQVKQVDAQCSIAHRIYSDQFPAWGRDFVTISRWEVHEDGVIEFDSFTEKPEDSLKMVPEVNHKVRGVINHAGYLIEPETDKSCNVTYAVQMDICGSVPSFIANRVLSKQPLCLATMQKFLAKCDLSKDTLGPVKNSSEGERPYFDF